jgi:hypothetical protein
MVAAALVLAGCGGGTTSFTTPNNTTYTVSASVSGLAPNASVVLQDNGADNTTVTTNGPAIIATSVASGTAYAVTVLTQPTGQTCTTTAPASGTVTANVTVAVTCNSPNTYSVSATVSGLASGASVVLQDNGADNTTVTANGTAVLATSVASGTAYAVTVLTQPTGQTCTTTAPASGTVTANVTVAVTCVNNTTSPLTLSAAVTGLTGGTLVLQDDQGDLLTFTTNSTAPFTNTYASGATYSVSVATQPTGLTCTPGSNATGTITANTTVTVTCAPTAFTLGVSVTGLGTGLTLSVEDGQNNSLQFTGNEIQTFADSYQLNEAYSVTITTQPTGQTCTLASNASGTIAGNTTVAATCVNAPPPTLTLSASVTGLTGTLVLTDDQSKTLTFTTNTTQTFSNQYATGATYTVTVTTPPTGENCLFTNNTNTISGTITANTTVAVTCTPSGFTIGGAINGYTGTGLVLQDNGGNNLTVNQGATSFTFAGTVPTGTAYSVTVFTQPNTPTQTCTVATGTGSGTVGTANVTSVVINCTTNSYTIGGTISGLTASGLTLLDNGSNANLPASGATSFTFTTKIASGDTYAVTVSTEPTGLSCTVTANATGTVTNANITNVVVTCVAASSTNIWTWQNGTDTTAVFGIYPSSHGGTGTPGSRYGASSWTDSSGNLWLFGGFGNGINGSQGYMSDLWKYTPSANTWTWVAGPNDSDQNGVYPPSTPTVPGGRSNAVSWKDSSGNLWLFGGFGLNGDTTSGAGILNDLWEFTTAGTWNFVGGSTILTFNASGVYGTKGSCPSGTTCFPGSRYSATGFADPSGNFWLSGGQGIDSVGNQGLLNDLWEFSNGSWTWVSGSDTANASPSYPTTNGTFSASNVPGARQNSTSWFDAFGNFWLFGGNGIGKGSATPGELNDLWEFSTTSAEWAWITGANVTGQAGQYGNEGQSGSGNTPGSRERASGWLDASGNFWLFGGIDANGGEFNDLWEFTGGNWIWMNGSSSTDSPGTYGTEGQGTSLTTPGSRDWASSWTDNSGNLWLFGGDGIAAEFPEGYLNDLWEYLP